jgi:hypothetical protein
MQTDMRDIKLTSLSLINQDYKVQDLEAAQEGGSLEITTNLEFVKSKEAQNIIKMIVHFEIEGSNSEEVIFSLKQRYIADYSFEDTQRFFEDKDPDLAHYCLSIAYPSIREGALSLFSKSNIFGVELPFSPTGKPDVKS